MDFSSGSEVTRYQYKGQYSYELDFGLQFYNARWYDPALGRFAQADSIIPGAGNSAAWDRYAYTLNNPLRYTDPSGHWVETAIDIASIAYDIYDIHQNGVTWVSGGALALDVVCAVVPIAAGGGALLRAATHVDDVGDAVKAIDGADELLDFAKKIGSAGENADPDDIRKLLDSPLVTHNPDAKTVSLGSNRLYQKEGYTYFSIDDPAVWNALGKNGQDLVNDQFMADQAFRGKSFTFTLSDPLFPGKGSEREMKWLNKLAGEGVYEKVNKFAYREALQFKR